MSRLPLGKGKVWFIVFAVIGIIRLIAALGETLSTEDVTSKEKYSYSEERQDYDEPKPDEEEYTYADRSKSQRDEDDLKRDKKNDSSEDSRGRTSDEGDSSGTREYPLYTITMPGEGGHLRASYDWSYKNHMMKRKDYEVVLMLLKSIVRKEQDVLEDLQTSSLEELGVDPALRDVSEIKFQLALWRGAYRKMYLASMDNFDPLIRGLDDIFKKEEFNTKEKLDFLVTFVQNIRYDRPGGDLDVLPPMVTLARKYGDCDTKSLLLYVLLEKFGYDCVIMWSQHYKHAMLGLYTRASGDFKEKSGKKYYFVETTYPGWMIGQLPPKWDNTRYWHIIKL